MGSPPRVREKLSSALSSRCTQGITPACAGKTISRCANKNALRDHPRVCGKNYTVRSNKWLLKGSPPRVREKPVRICRCVYNARITPACAGKTFCFDFHSKLFWDHPRVCGKNVLFYKRRLLAKGSPPRVREKHEDGKITDATSGITPACAGKTAARRFRIRA